MVNIKVAVRIRPMSLREQCQRDSNIVTNSDKCILVTNPKIAEKLDGADSRQRVRRFAVDYCYDPKYPEMATQQAVFEEIGMEVVEHMLGGYNACVLAYGHSASGKTYTMMGHENDPGLTPRICTEIGQRMRTLAHHHVSVSFLEIYNEKVRDLLVDGDPDTDLSRGYSLRVREHPKLGPYVQDLSEHVVDSEEELLRFLNLGNTRRRTAVTESNASSSRSHAVFTIKFKLIGDSTAKYSKVHLVDLAGSLQEEDVAPVKKVSERAGGTQSRTRMKEGANINKSLVTLGNVISALADSSETVCGKSWHPFVPYRDSVLTWLLKDTLGGNSNTIMIATISPGSSCYTDTINTLRYAKRTKKIVNQPLINEDPKVRTIRELRDEVSRLKTMLLSYTSVEQSLSLPLPSLAPTKDAGAMGERDSSSKWQGQGQQPTHCAVALQTDDMDLLRPTWRAAGMTMEMPHDLLGHLEVTSSNTGTGNSSEGDAGQHWVGVIKRATPDILPCGAANKHISCCLVPGLHVCQINAGNEPGVNRVIADPVRLSESGRQKCNSGAIVPRVSRTPFKRRRTFLRRTSFLWDMLHRSRPDLIKGIGARQRAPEPPSSSLADPLSQSTSENSLHSPGSADSRVGSKQGASLSRTSSVDNGSGSSTPTQPKNRPIIRQRRENKRAEIVASVTSRLYATKKKPDPRQEALIQASKEKEDDDDDELDELNLCKRARMKLFDMSRKMALTKKVKRTADSDTQTDSCNMTLRVKEKCVATDQQGFVQLLTSSTNTPADNDLQPSPPMVMNQVFISGSGKFLMDCSGSSVSLVPSEKCNSECQTVPESKDQSTSPENIFTVNNQIDDCCSDDSLESDNCSSLKTRKLGHFRSCYELNQTHATHHAPRYHSMPHIQLVNNDSFLVPDQNMRVEKSLEQIMRYNINGTNAFYEYDPNKSIGEKIIFSNLGNKPMYGPEGAPPVMYQNYQSQYSKHNLHSSSDDSKNILNSSTEDNSSSETSAASLACSVESNDSSSSDDFIFMEKKNCVPAARELYTISENSEASCSNRSSPLSANFTPPNDIKENEHMKHPKVSDNDHQEPPKKVHWAEFGWEKNNKFINFNYTPSQLSGTNCKNSESLYKSDDSITFVFLGQKEKQTSVLMEIIKRCTIGGSDQVCDNSLRKEKGIQCNGKLMRSVSMDTAMIALSRLSRQERSELSKASSISNIVSEQTQVNLDNMAPLGCSENGVQCSLVEKVDKSCDIHPRENETQCDLDKMPSYSIGTNTISDKGTETTPEQSECTTQTDIGQLFDALEPELPRTTVSTIQGLSSAVSPDIKSNLLEKEIRNIILGAGKDLFPNYLQNENFECSQKQNNRKSTKTVSWSDLTVKQGQDVLLNDNGENDINEEQNIMSTEDNAARAHTLPRRKSIDLITAFVKEATSLLQNVHSDSSESSDSEEGASLLKSKYSSSSLLRRRKKKLSRIKVKIPSRNSNECSIQTEVEKVDKVIQTDDFQSPRIGHSPRRSLTPNFQPTLNDELNSTWPRRRVATKPPPSPRINRAGSSASRVTVSSTNGSISSRNSGSLRASAQLSSVPQSPTKQPTNNYTIENSRQRLQIAVALDKMRQRNLDDRLSLYFSDEYSSSGQFTSKLANNRDFPTESHLLQYTSNFDADHNRESYSRDDNYRKFCDFKVRQRDRTDLFRRSELSTTKNSDVEVLSSLSSHGDSYRESKLSSLLSQCDATENNRSSTNSQIGYKNSANCECSCHSYLCGDLVDHSNHHCHTCCVPCASQPSRPYSSEPSLSLLQSVPSRKTSPLAHLRQLISVRRNIVEAEKRLSSNHYV